MISFRISRRQVANPTARSGRWGFFRVLPGLSLLLILCAIAVAMVGCAGSSLDEWGEPGKAGFSAPEDSLGLEEFLSLNRERQQARRGLAGEWLERSQKASKASDRMQALANAGGLTPDDPEIWLRLAKVWRWLGDNIQTKVCLDNAATAVRGLGRNDSVLENRSSSYRMDAALRTGVLRAWHHYDRAEYSEGLSWAKAAVKLESGNALAIQVMGVLEGSLGHRYQAQGIAGDINRARGYHTDAVWILSNLERSVGRNREAFNYYLGLRPIEDHAAECFRDMGLTAERVQEWSYARRWYRDSAAHLPFEDTSSLVKITHPRLDTRYRASDQPVWLAFGRYFVTGSRSAYTALAFERFENASSPQEKDHWAGLVVNSAGICLRMKEDVPWALKARGIVFSRTGKEDRGLEDLRRASSRLMDLGIEDGRVEAEIGHLLLIREEQTRALHSLRRAVELEADYAAAWSDLGLALIMTDDREAAEAALTKALEIDPSSVTAWYNRGLLNLHAGLLDEAEADLLKAAELAPDNQDVARLLQQVSRQRNEGN